MFEKFRQWWNTPIRISTGVVNPFNASFLINNSITNYNFGKVTYLEKGYNINPFVYSVINQMATKTGSIPFYLKKPVRGQKSNLATMFQKSMGPSPTPAQKIRLNMMMTKAYDDEFYDMPLAKPNPNQTWSELWALYKTFYRMSGEAYFYILRRSTGNREPMAVYLLPSHMVEIVIKNDAQFLTEENAVDHYVLSNSSQYVEFQQEEVIHIKMPNPNYDENGSHLYGMSPLRPGLKNIQSSNTALDQNMKTMANGGAFGLIHGKGVPLTEDEAKSLKDRLREMDASPENLSKIAGVSVDVGFTRLSLSADQLKPFDYLTFDEKQICNVLGWDDKLLNNDAGAKYDNVLQARKRVITDNIEPDLNALSEAFTDQFLPMFASTRGYELCFDYSELPEMQDDLTKLNQWLSASLDRGVITRNEYRVALGYQKMDDKDMDEVSVNFDVIKLSDAIEDDYGQQQ